MSAAQISDINYEINKLVGNLSTSLFFIGPKDTLPKSGNLGDVCYVDQSTFIWNGERWELIGDVSNTQPQPKHKKIKYTHCKSCGAPTSLIRDYCLYCGTPYEYEYV